MTHVSINLFSCTPAVISFDGKCIAFRFPLTWEKRHALHLFKDRKVSLAKAAEIAGTSTREMMDLVKEKGVSLHITTEDIREDFKAAMKF